MNDFTKEELADLYELVNEVCKDYCPYNDEDDDLEEYWIPLKGKIQDMIDNYCEHEEEYEDFNYAPMRCKKCLEITG